MSQAKAPRICERCGKTQIKFINVDAGMRLAIQASPDKKTMIIPSQVCEECYSELGSQVSRGAKLRIEQQAREKNKQMLWTSRVNLVKQARYQMSQKSFSDAAVSYEKYLRVVEMAYDKKKGGLTAEVFGSTVKSNEITVLASVYWDLVRIYDSHPNYRQKMAVSADKLKEFLPYSRVYADISRKAHIFLTTCNNKDIIKKLLADAKAKKPKCFIATAAFEAPMAPEVQYLRQFRDEKLLRYAGGPTLIRVYYKLSPTIADWIEKSKLRKQSTRSVLRLFIKLLEKIS